MAQVYRATLESLTFDERLPAGNFQFTPSTVDGKAQFVAEAQFKVRLAGNEDLIISLHVQVGEDQSSAVEKAKAEFHQLSLALVQATQDWA